MQPEFPHIPVGTPIRILTHGLCGAPPEIDVVVDEILLEWAVSAQSDDGRYWLVMEEDFVQVHTVQ